MMCNMTRDGMVHGDDTLVDHDQRVISRILNRRPAEQKL